MVKSIHYEVLVKSKNISKKNKNKNTSKESSINYQKIWIKYNMMLIFVKSKCVYMVFVHCSLYFAACLKYFII